MSTLQGDDSFHSLVMSREWIYISFELIDKLCIHTCVQYAAGITQGFWVVVLGIMIVSLV